MFLKLFGRKSKKNDSGGAGSVRLVDGIDLEMNYCPACNEEYRSDISICVSCNVQLINGNEKLRLTQELTQDFHGRSMDISPADELVTIRKGPLAEIKTLQKMLERERIPCIIAGDENSCSKGCCGGEMFLQIKESDLEPTTAVLAKDFVASTALDLKDLEHADVVFDHQSAETACPACGCRFSPTVGACPECGLCFE